MKKSIDPTPQVFRGQKQAGPRCKVVIIFRSFVRKKKKDEIHHEKLFKVILDDVTIGLIRF